MADLPARRVVRALERAGFVVGGQRLTQIGFVVLLGIMILATSNDVLRWLGHVFKR